MRKPTSAARVPQMKLAALAVMSCFASTAALANPTGVISSSGVVSMATPAPNVLEITNHPGAIINWQGFSIGATELTRFIQNSASSAVLNRVMGPTQSDILGTLTSNGRVFLINPNGITIGAGAFLDLPGFVASSLGMTDADFLAGRMRFQEVPGTTGGPVTNRANISMPAGGQVYLIGGTVMNDVGGMITSPNGEVVLAAGQTVELASAGAPGVSVLIAAPANQAVNLGQVFADSGRAGIFGGVVNQGGVVSANTVIAGADGSVRLVATDTVHVAAGSSTSALGGTFEVDAGELRVAGDVHSGTQRIRASGGVVVENPVGGFAQLGASGGQAIDAGYVEVTGNAGGSASIFNFGGEQRITTTATNAAGEGLAVRSNPGGFALVDAPAGNQTIEVHNAQSAAIDGGAGTAYVTNNSGVQTLSLTGSGANALVLGASGGPGQSVIGGGGFQTVRAGNAGELGSITIQGPNSGMPSNPVFGGTQTIEAQGALSIVGGGGISANGLGGQQTIRAQSILVQAGAAGSGNNSAIHAFGGSQWIEAGAGGITLRGGADGENNFVQINQASTDPLATQTITSAGPVRLESGAGNFNFTMIRSFGGHQSLTFGDTLLLAGAGGIDNFSVIQGRDQDITVRGSLALVGQGSSGSPTIGGGARIGGLGGGAPSPTSLRLNVDNEFSMTGGSVSGTLLGNTTNFTGDTNISLHAGGNVWVSGGTEHGVYSAIGSRAGNEAGGHIDITAGGTIALNSTAFDQASIIRTTDDVTLNAQQVTQGSDAFIQAHTLTVNTQQGASLPGNNQIDAFNANNSWFGDVTLRNASPLLTMTSVQNWSGGLRVQQTGDLLVNGTVNSGPQAIDVTGGLVVRNQPFGFAELYANNGQTINAGFLEVNAVTGGSAAMFNFGGDQRIVTSGANAAGEGFAVRNSGGDFAGIQASFGAQSIDVRHADKAVIDGSGGVASVIDIDGTQSFRVTGAGANALVLGSPGALAQSVIGGGGFQTVVAGDPGEQGSITLHGTQGGLGNTLIVSNPVFGGRQTVSTTGAISVYGGSAPSNSAAGIFANGIAGQQNVSAASILLQGGDTGFGNTAFIGANNGSQTIHAGAGGIMLRGGAAGGNNFVQINQASTDPAATQAVTSIGPVLLEGGSGNFNFALMRGFGGHQELVFGNTTLLAGASGIDNFSVILGPSQDMTVHGNLALVARGSAGSPTIGGGVRIGGIGGGGLGPTPTDLRLHVDGDFSMTAGSVAGTGAQLGNTGNNFTGTTDISLFAGGDVSLSGGTAEDTYSLIGSRAGNLAGGAISITAGGDIALKSTAPDRASIIRTADAVTLSAQQITQGPDARIEAGSLTTNTQQGAQLGGANAVSRFDAFNSWFGDVTLHNAAPLLTVTSVQNWAGALQLQQAGDMRVTGNVFSGPQDIDVSGGLVVQNDPFGYAQLAAQGGQSIRAAYIELNGQAGGSVFISNFGGDQAIATTGANAAADSLAIRSSGGAFSAITGSGGNQSILLSGPGPNALIMENLGGGGGTNISGDVQTITAGNPGEAGSITLRGAASQINSSPLPGGSQTIATSGILSLTGSDTEFSFAPAGIFANGMDGKQTIRANAISLQGGDGGNGAVIVAIDGSQLVEAGAGGISLNGAAAPGNGGVAITQQSGSLGHTQTVRSAGAIALQGGSVGGGNSAVVIASGGAQLVEAGAGGITLVGGPDGSNNLAMINQSSPDPAATQTVRSAGPLHLQGGDAGFFNFAMIRGFGGLQTIEAGPTSLLAGAGGTNDFAAVIAPKQRVTVHGDLSLTARGSDGTPTVGGGTRIGGLGGAAPTPTDLTLDVHGNITLTGGSIPGTGSGIGGNSDVDLPLHVSVHADGDVTLNPGSMAGSRIGSAAGAVAAGEIRVDAGGTIALNSAAPGIAAAIRANDGVTLHANRITQGVDAQIQAGTLTLVTAHGASLVGDNSVAVLNASNGISNAIAYNNASALLTVTGINQVSSGALNLSQAGNLLVNGNVTSGAQSISASGDMTVTPGAGPNVTVHAYGPQTFNVGGTFSLLGGNAWNGYAQTLATGPVRIATGDDLIVRAGGGLLAYALLYGGDDIRLTVGDELRIDGGRWPTAFARVQADFWDRIFLTFPNRASGGYFVDGREGRTVHGLDGFFTGLRPAVRGRSLVVSYGE